MFGVVRQKVLRFWALLLKICGIKNYPLNKVGTSVSLEDLLTLTTIDATQSSVKCVPTHLGLNVFFEINPSFWVNRLSAALDKKKPKGFFTWTAKGGGTLFTEEQKGETPFTKIHQSVKGGLHSPKCKGGTRPIHRNSPKCKRPRGTKGGTPFTSGERGGE